MKIRFKLTPGLRILLSAKRLPLEDEDLILQNQYSCKKAGCCTMHLHPQTWGGRNSKIPGNCWPALLAAHRAPGLTGEDISKYKVESDEGRHPTPTNCFPCSLEHIIYTCTTYTKINKTENSSGQLVFWVTFL